MTDTEKLEAALKFVRKQYVDVAVNTTVPAIVSEYQEQYIDEILEAGRAHLNLLKAIEDKRLAVVPLDLPKHAKLEGTKARYVNVRKFIKEGKEDAGECPYKSAISAVDQQEILKELEV